MPSYIDVKSTFESKDCILQTTAEEFINIKARQPKYKYIAKCGHNHEVFFNVFKSRGTGILCPKCTTARNAEKAKETIKEDKLSNLKIEKYCIDYIIEKAATSLQIIKAFDGCKADMICKPNIVTSDSWIGIQVKSTVSNNKGYSFHLQEDYQNCIILCMCKEDKKIWIFPSEDVNHLKKISIGLTTSKYDIYECTNNLEDKLLEYYRITKKFTFEVLDTPIGNNQQREQLYRKLRENKIKFLNFIDNGMEGLVYDFKIDNFKVQEKVGTFCKKNIIIFCLFKNNGKIDKKRQTVSYSKDDNDFYWLNFPDKKHFYVFPQQVLIEQGYVDSARKHIYINLTKIHEEDWKSDYLFDYDNLDEERLTKMFINKATIDV